MDKIELAGFTAEQTESIREAARKYAERTTFTVEEAIEPRVRRRKRNRARAKIIEQRYRAEIRRVENTRIYRRIYKPP